MIEQLETFIEAIRTEAKRAIPLWNKIKILLPDEIDVDWNFSYKHPDSRDIVITVWSKDPEWVADNILSVLRSQWGCFYSFTVSPYAKHLEYRTTINNIHVVISSYYPAGCEWAADDEKNSLVMKAHTFKCS